MQAAAIDRAYLKLVLDLSPWSPKGPFWQAICYTDSPQVKKCVFVVLAACVLNAQAGGNWQRAMWCPGGYERQCADPSGLPDAIINWFVDAWRTSGFDMPKEGDPFDWYKYLSYVPKGAPEPGDLIECLEDGHPICGMVITNYFEVYAGCTSDIDVFVTVPIAPNVCRMKLIEKRDVIGYMRPHEAKV